jgi:sugar fermentation stimulation protein A
VPELAGYASLRREVAYGTNSRIDLLLESADRARCFVEVKSTTLREGDAGLFPDAVTERGKKHLTELARVARAGERAVQLFLVSRSDVRRFRPADAIDPAYGEALRGAARAGVEVLAYATRVGPRAFELGARLLVEEIDADSASSGPPPRGSRRPGAAPGSRRGSPLEGTR